MSQKKIQLIVFIFSTFLSATVLAANDRGKAPYLYFLHDQPLSAVQENSIRAPGNNNNVFSLAANEQCEQSAFLTLQGSLAEAISAAIDTNNLTYRPVYIYRVGANYNMFSLRRTIMQYAPQISEPFRSSLIRYMQTDSRYFTHVPIQLRQIAGVFVVDMFTRARGMPPYTQNNAFDGLSPGVNPRPYTFGGNPPWQATQEYIRFIYIAQNSTPQNVCTVQPFVCSTSRPTRYMSPSSESCISPDEIVKTSWSTALAYKMLPVLFSQFSDNNGVDPKDEL